MYGTTNPSEWTNLGDTAGNVGGIAVENSKVFQIRGPVETGKLPSRSIQPDDGRSLNMDVSEQNWSPELRGRINIQAGP